MTTEETLLEQLSRMHGYGWCGPEKALALYRLVRDNDARVCVDVGVFAGKSCLSMAFACKEKKSGIVVAVDAWEKGLCTFDADEAARNWWSTNVDLELIYRKFLTEMVATETSPYIRVLRMSSWNASRFVDEPIDVLHIDGSHDEFSSSCDVCYWLPRLRVGGHVCLDDYDWASLQTAVKLTRKCCDEIQIVNTEESHSAIYRKVREPK